MLKAVIFDLDGVIIDSEPLHKRAVKNALLQFGVELKDEYCNQFIGTTVVHMMDTICKDYNLTISLETLFEANKQAKEKLLKEEGYSIIPGIRTLISDLYNHGILLAVASSSTKEEIESAISNLSSENVFSVLLSGTQVANPKPAPDIFLETAKLLSVDPSECVVIEDSHLGVIAAKAAGMTRIGFMNTNSGNQDLSQVNFVVENFEEVDYKFVNQVYIRSKGKPITIAETPRLLIRELTVEDIKVMYTIYQQPKVREFIDDIDNYLNVEIEKHKAYIKNVYSFYGYGYWGVFSKETGKLIGRCGIQNNEIDNRMEIELGYLLDVNHWGYGYALECVKCVLSYAFFELQIPRIVAVIDKFNIRSQKVAERVGMKKEKEFKYNFRNCYLYSIYRPNV